MLGLLFLSFYRCIEFFVLRGMITDQTTAVMPAFIRGLWFDNVMGCYVMISPLALVLSNHNPLMKAGVTAVVWSVIMPRSTKNSMQR